MSSMSWLRVAAGIVVFAGAGSAHAQDPASTSARAIEIQQTCPQGQTSALSEIACEFANALAAIPAGTLVVAAPASTTVPLRQPGRLEARMAAVVAGRLRHGARAAPEAANLAVARSLASGNGTLLHLRIEIAEGRVRVEGDVYPVPAKFWERVRDPLPSPVFHAFAERALDPELRTYLPAVPLVARETVKAKSPEHQPVALACADVDADGATELVVAGRRGIHLARIREGTVRPLVSRQWTDLASVASAPLREPVASISVHSGNHIDVGISDRAHAIRFDPQLTPIAKMGRRLPWPGGEGCSRIVGLVIGPQLHRCGEADDPPLRETFGWGTDALASAAILGSDGQLHHYLAGRIANKGEARLISDNGEQAQVLAVGAQLALGDLDGDGRPELIAGTNTMDASQDAIVVRSWTAIGQIVERLRIPVPPGVHAIAICPQPSASLAPIAIAAGREIWVVR